MEEKQFAFKIPKKYYESFEKDLNELIERYKEDDKDTESFQVQIYKLS